MKKMLTILIITFLFIIFTKQTQAVCEIRSVVLTSCSQSMPYSCSYNYQNYCCNDPNKVSGGVSIECIPSSNQPAIQICVPNSRLCDNGSTKILRCDSSGFNYSVEQDCQNIDTLARCYYTEGEPNCKSPGSAQCQAYLPGDPSCILNCRNCGKTQSECVEACTSATTPGQQTGGGGDGPSEVTPANIVNIDALIGSMKLNTACLADKTTGIISLGGIISCLLPYVYAFAGVGLLLFLMLAGFSYLTSAGDAKKAEAAKGKLTAAVIGFIIIIVAFWLTQIVNAVFKLGTGV